MPLPYAHPSPALADDLWFEDEDESATSGTKDDRPLWQIEAEAQALLKTFDPHQPRDPHTGEWIKVPGGSGDLAEFALGGGRGFSTGRGEPPDESNMRPRSERKPLTRQNVASHTTDELRAVLRRTYRFAMDTPPQVALARAELKRRKSGGDLAKFETAPGWDTTADQAVESARKAHSIPQARRYEVSVNGMVMQGESRDFPSAVDAVVRAHDQGQTDVKVMVKRGTSMTQEPSAEDHAAILEAATAVISRRTAKDELPEAEQRAFDEILGPPPDHKLTPKPTISPEVQKAVTDRASATKFVKDKTGIDLKFGDFKGNKGFWQEIAQSTLDTTKRFPVLTQGGKYGRLARIGLDSELPDHEQLQDVPTQGSVWASTSWDVSQTHSLGTHVSIPKDFPKAGGDAWITLYTHPGDTDPLDQPVAEGSSMDSLYEQGMAAQPDRWVYGRLMHEMGHATVQVSGAEWAKPSRDDTPVDEQAHGIDRFYACKEIEWMMQANLAPSDVAQFSGYAAKSPVEAWAEIFVTLNAPHGMDGLDPKVKAKLLHLQQIANDWAAFHKVPGGRIL